MNFSETIFSACIGAVAAVGLFVLGWPISLASGTPFRTAGSWIAGLCVLYSSVFICQICGLPLRLPVVAIIALMLSLTIWLIGRRWICLQECLEQGDLKKISSFPLLLFGAAIFIFALRAFLQPLQGADTLFRWEFLARMILLEENIDFYPPRVAEDFRKYFYPDGISPLAALCHWWVYAIRGARDPSATYAVLTSSYVISMLLIVCIAAGMAGAKGAKGACYAAVGSPILFWSFLQGQETGLMVVGVLGATYYLRLGKQTHGSAFMAGLSLALASLAREYGAGLAAGVVISNFFMHSRIKWGVLLPSFVVIGGSWYVRNWVLSGNPFYSLSFAGIFPVNMVLKGMLESCKQTMGWSAIGIEGAFKATGHILQLAFLPTSVGVAVCLLRTRDYAWFACPAAIGLAIWAHAVGYTSGGIVHSYRVLAPVIALGAAVGGVIFAQIACLPRPINLCRFMWPIVAVYGLVNSLTIPLLAKSVSPEKWLTEAFTLKQPSRDFFVSDYWPAKILTDNAYLYAKAQGNDRGFEVFSIWSPAVAFLFDNNLPDQEKIRRLEHLGITHLTPQEPDSVFWGFYQRYSFFLAAFKEWPRNEKGFLKVPQSSNDISERFYQRNEHHNPNP